MRSYAPTVSTPGVYSPVEESAVMIESIQLEFDNDPEVGEALNHYVFSLENGISEPKAYESLRERLFFLYLRSKRRAEVRERDAHEDGGIGA